MGYQDGTRNYRVWEFNTRSITTTRDVVFTNIAPISSANTPNVDVETISIDTSSSPPSQQPVRRLRLRVNPQQQPAEEIGEIIYVKRHSRIRNDSLRGRLTNSLLLLMRIR